MNKFSNIVERVKYLQDKSKLSNYYVCHKCNINTGHYGDVLKYYPKRNFTIDQLKNLAFFFGVSTDWLIWGKERDLNKELEQARNEVLIIKRDLDLTIDAYKTLKEIHEVTSKFIDYNKNENPEFFKKLNARIEGKWKFR